jgi:hypothetical protein
MSRALLHLSTQQTSSACSKLACVGSAPLANRGGTAPSHRADQNPAQLGQADDTRAAAAEHPDLITNHSGSTSSPAANSRNRRCPPTTGGSSKPTSPTPATNSATAAPSHYCYACAEPPPPPRWRASGPTSRNCAAPTLSGPTSPNSTKPTLTTGDATTGNHTHADPGGSSSSHIGHARAPCVLGCPDTARHPTAPDNTGVGRYPDRTVSFDTTKHRPTQDRRTLNPQVGAGQAVLDDLPHPWRRMRLRIDPRHADGELDRSQIDPFIAPVRQGAAIRTNGHMVGISTRATGTNPASRRQPWSDPERPRACLITRAVARASTDPATGGQGRGDSDMHRASSVWCRLAKQDCAPRLPPENPCRWATISDK